MKNIFLSSILVFAGLSLATSCKKDKKDTEPTVPGTPTLKTMALSIDGTAIETNYYSSQATSGLIIVQSWPEPHLISLRIADTVAAGQIFDMGPAMAANLSYSNDNYATSYSTQSGTMTIAVYDTVARKLSGNYSCILFKDAGSPVKTVTNGQFNVSY